MLTHFQLSHFRRETIKIRANTIKRIDPVPLEGLIKYAGNFKNVKIFNFISHTVRHNSEGCKPGYMARINQHI